MQRHQRRRAGGVDRHRRSAHVQKIPEPRSQNAIVVGGDVAAPGQKLVVALLDADEHPDLAAAKLGCAIAGVFQRLPGFHQQESLPRVHQFRLARRDLKKQWIKLTHVRDKATPFAIGLARLPLWIAVIPPPIKPIRGNLLDRIFASGQDLP